MRAELLKLNLEKLLKQRSAVTIFAVSMMISNIILGIALMTKDEKIIVVPPQLKQSVWLSESKVSKEYLEEMGIFITSLILDISPASASYKRDMLLKHVSSSFHNTLKKKLMEEETKMLTSQFATSFRPIEAEVKDDSLEMKIKGELVTYVGSKNVKQERVIYALKFEYKLGNLLLTTFLLEEQK